MDRRGKGRAKMPSGETVGARGALRAGILRIGPDPDERGSSVAEGKGPTVAFPSADLVEERDRSSRRSGESDLARKSSRRAGPNDPRNR